jgi:hypothetical protein
MRDCVGYFHVGHAQFVETILQKSLFLGREIAFRFLGNHSERVDGLTRADHVNSGLAALFVHQAHLHHGRHVERSHEAFKTHFEFFGRVPAQFDTRIQIARRLFVGVMLRLLLRGRRGFGNV